MSETRAAPASEEPRRLDPDLFAREVADRLRFLRWLVERGRLSDWGPPAAARERQRAA